MVNKITTPPTQNEVIDKINELVDDKQDKITSSNKLSASLVSGLATVATSGNYTDLSNKPTIDSALSTSSTNAAQNKVITSALNGKLDGFTLRFAGNWSGGVHAVNFVTIDYSECNSENGVFIKFSMVNSHGNGQAGRFLQDVVLNVKYTGEVAGTLYRYFAVPIDQASSEYYGSHSYGDVFWVNDTTNKVVRFYVLMHQYSYTSQSPYFRLNASTKGVITQSTGGTGASEYSSGTRVWTTVNWFETDQTYSATSPKPQSGVAVASAISGKANSADLATVATSGSYNDLSNKPTIPTVNNATLTIQKNGSNVATFTANASSNVTANITVPTTTSSVTSGSTAALTSGGAYTNLVRRKSTSAATGSASQGVYVDANGQVQTCDAVTSTYAATSTAPLNGVAVSNAIATKQDNLVSGTNIKTINGNSLLGSGNITIETSSTPNVDGTTISYNANDALQTIAVKNVRDNSTLPIWHGTEYQWNHGDPTTWYYWQTSVTALWTSGGSLGYSSFKSVAYGDGNFVAVGDYSRSAYSTDGGATWQNPTMVYGPEWYSVAYGNGRFVAIIANNKKSAYSTDGGVTWQSGGDLPSNAVWYSVAYGNGRFVAITVGGKSACSTDGGVTWQSGGDLPSNEDWNKVAYGDGNFVAVGDYSRSAYSTDGGVTWNSATLPYFVNWYSIAYGDGRFVAVGLSKKSAYSTDGGVTWQSGGDLQYDGDVKLAYGNNMFVYVSKNSNVSAYSTDGGVTWQRYTLSSLSWSSIAYGNERFVAVGDFNSNSAIFTVQYDKCYTDTANPTTTSVVYSEPETVSSYTISSVTSGAITLSNNNTYYYNQSGNAYTYQTIGDAHPEYLCFIDGVGVKMGNTTIATNNSNNS